ncbi:MAG: hypothetical protein GY866_42725 [Proteobacteria bacterium]|nr:hypothetical protein [Pseudomonadota bacterium]
MHRMQYRLISLSILLGSMILVVYTDLSVAFGSASPTLVLGFLLLAAYCMALFLEKLKLPRITGYIVAGLVLGPYLLGFFDEETISGLSFLNSLALAFIAFCAGGELRISYIRSRLKGILFLITGVTVVVFVGVTLTVFLMSAFIPFMSGYNGVIRLAISSIFGVVAVARSPSSTIAIISETKSEGDYTDTVLSVTIATDVVIIVLFGIVVSLCQVIVLGGGSIDTTFILVLLFEILTAFVVGFFLGKAIVFLIDNVKVEFPVVITGVGFMVIKFSHLLGTYLHTVHSIGVNLEPLLICMAAGFSVQNFSQHGEAFLAKMDRVSFPIYVAFFAITGASINVDVLKMGWILGLVIVCSRTIMIFAGSWLSGRLAGDRPEIYKNTWLGFITQAGVSLGLLTEVVRRFPEIGVPIQTILIASITLNQLLGPIAFKYALNKVGETNSKTKY